MAIHQRIKFRKVKTRKQSLRTLGIICLTTFLIAMLFSYIFEALLGNVPILIAFLMLITVIFIGVFFDAIGNAVVSADETTFHSMAAQKVKGAKESIMLIRNAPMVANLLNDVIGDIAGIISGSTAMAIILIIGPSSILFSIAMSGFVAALTVGGKAVGKGIAIERSRYIVYYVGVFIYYIKAIGRKNKN